MGLFRFFTLYPSRLLHTGAAVLSSFALLAGLMMTSLLAQPSLPLPRKNGKWADPPPLSALLPHELQPRSFAFEAGVLAEQFLLALCPQRPDQASAAFRAYVKLKGSSEAKLFPLPSKIGLALNEQEDLMFSAEEEQFRLELSHDAEGNLAPLLFLDYEGSIQKIPLRKQPALPLQRLEELPQEHAFQALTKARWLGTDLICRLEDKRVQRIEIGTFVLDLAEGDTIYWTDQRWVKIASSGDGIGNPLALVRTTSSQGVELDVWDASGERQFRIAVPPIPPASGPRAKPEEWFSALRVRSEKKISCVLEKQCLVLREQDWILKENGRWKVLRKAEEKQQLIQGKRSGDLIVLESIDTKRRTVQGCLIQANRVHSSPIELIAEKKALTSASRTGRRPS